jgi:hypothetical protein
MESDITCKCCGQLIKEIKCDTCGDKLNNGVPITLEYGYGHRFDETTCHFCSDGCLKAYLQGECNK